MGIDLLTREETGAEIARLREERGMPQAELGDVAGLDQTAMSKVESGKRSLSAGELLAVASHLAVDPQALLHREYAVLHWRADSSEASEEAKAVLSEIIADFFAFEAVGG